MTLTHINKTLASAINQILGQRDFGGIKMDHILEEFIDNVQNWKRVEVKTMNMLKFVSIC